LAHEWCAFGDVNAGKVVGSMVSVQEYDMRSVDVYHRLGYRLPSRAPRDEDHLRPGRSGASRTSSTR
jgi:hypothetical protein